MAAGSRSGSPGRLSQSEQWVLATATLIIFGFLAYAVYDAAVATASELLQRLVVVSPLLLVIAVHWLSIANNADMGAGFGGGTDGFPWGVALLLLLLLFPWSAAFLLLLLYFFFVTN